MKELDVVIQNPTGLHARPAKVFVNTAKKFQANIRVRFNDKEVNAKSMISMLTLGVQTGGNIQILIDGEDEESAFEALQTIIADGLGEGGVELETAPKSASAPSGPAAQEPPVTQTKPAVSEPGVIKGVAAAPGIAIGPVFQFRQEQVEVVDAFTDAKTEIARLQHAREIAHQQLQGLHSRMVARGNPNEAVIFEAHQELLADDSLLQDVHHKISDMQSAAAAWQTSVEEWAVQLAALDDPLLAARAADMRDVGQRVLRLLAGQTEVGVKLPDHPVILFAADLAPSDTAALDTEKVLAFCTAAGGSMSHSAIIARALNLPAVTGAGEQTLDLADGTQVIIDGFTGEVLANPSQAQIDAAQKKQTARAAVAQAARARSAEPGITLDGHQLEIAANIGGAADARRAVAAGAEGVGLLRTEFLFLERREPPSEDEQYEVYREIVEAMDGRPVIIRTLDIGGDKPLPYIDVPPEENPFLGERGIRLCLNRPELLQTQLRAIYRAAAHGLLRIMFPMVTSLSEWRQARAMAEAVRQELDAPVVDLGIMVEVPAVAMTADLFASEVDFFSIGTNDLTQYTLAIDRGHPVMASQYDGLHPAVLRLIERTAVAAHAAGKWIGICGELGSDPQAIPILVGLGLDELSVSPPAIPAVKEAVRRLTLTEAQALAQKALRSESQADVRSLVSLEPA